ncbi:MAG: tRNA (adenosine(37)-N6)-threonylcarbamoyltransferase complex dimerization subunit type 1 TsaB [Acidobacteria bacterium]|nr:tRNA (adenosine(37)-N6)-threonylcarbamoyltransferase complex dimerization subunit type 1 TsaB [Acidobacteriota bacterium]
MSNLNSNDETSPIVLAVDTSSANSGFALAQGGKLIASLKGDASIPHSRTFFLQLSELLKKAGIGLNEVQFLAAATGPGSFTGLRVGLAAIKGLAHSLGKPAFGVNSMDALALSVRVKGDVLAIIEAGRKEIYSGVRRITEVGDILPLGEDRVWTLESMLNSDLSQQAFTVVGALPDELLVGLPNWQVCMPITSIAEEIALRVPELSRSCVECTLRPHYIRPSDAELNRKG